MQNLKLKTLLVTILALQLCVAFAEPVSDRITVTVRGNGPDVVLIPGLACSSAVWDAPAKQLEGKYRLHIVQVAGFAGSPALANANGPIIQPTVDAIDAYIRTNHLKAPKVTGHSLGGLMGMMLAIQHPDDVGKLMVIDSLPFFSVLMGATDVSEATPRAVAMRDSILAQSKKAYAQSQTNFLRRLVKSPKGFKAATTWAIASDKSVVARAMYEVMTTDLRPRLSEIKTPVTILYPWDTLSGFPQGAVEKLYEENFAAMPNKKLVRVDGSFHFIMFDQPEIFAEKVDTFLK